MDLLFSHGFMGGQKDELLKWVRGGPKARTQPYDKA